MNPETVFCPKLSCAARGKVGVGNIRVHSEQEGRYRCDVCNETFTTTYGTIFYRLRTAPDLVMIVLVLLANGCPIPAIVAAYGFDERTIKNWWKRGGVHCEAVHTHVIGGSKLELVQVQADEIRVKIWGGVVWHPAGPRLAIMVPTRLWIGGVISPRRDKALIQHLADQIRACALCRPLLLAVDGLASYPGAFKRAFRAALPRRRGRPGRPTLVEWPDIVIVQVVKHRTRHTFDLCRRIVQGTQPMVDRLLRTSQGGGVINTAFIERLNATFRQRLAWLTRRSRCLAHQPELLHASMFMVGTLYNFCDFHHALRLPLWLTATQVHWVHRTPAMAAGLTDHQWSLAELFGFRVPPPPWTPPKRRGRPSQQTLDLIKRWCA